jgi:molybdopterin-guanine dinucleotide biosynthesis protein A
MGTISDCSGVILSGGLSSRFSGRNKAFLEIDGKTILERIVAVFADLFDEIILVTNEPLAYADWDVKIVSDLFEQRSSLTGLHAGLFYTTRPYAFFTACDTPFVNPGLVRLLVDNIDPTVDVVVPETEKGLEPLFAVYSRRCIKPFRESIEQQKFKISRVFSTMRVRTVPETRLRRKDPDLISFFNINAPEDLTRATQLAANGKNNPV